VVSSPNEPGPGERPANTDGSTDVPPWQNAARNRADALPTRVATEAPVRAAAAVSSVGDPRRYVTGSAAPDLSGLGPAAERTDVAGFEPFRSELPDLSGPAPKPPQHAASPRKAAADPAPRAASAPTTRIAVDGRSRGPVRATMQVRRIDPWSALKVSLLLNTALFFVWMIAVAFLYLVLGAMGVWSKLNSNVGDLLTSGSGGGGGDLVSAVSIFGGAALVGLVNIVLLTAMATIGAYIYNLSTDIVGGVEVTLADLD
jgi:hypothetical protein